MKKTFQALRETFESSCSQTPQYLAFHRLFKREFSALLKKLGCSKIEIGRPNHFDVSGFFQAPNGQLWYFSLSDLRWSKESLLIRTAQHSRDYTGGVNHFLSLNDPFIFTNSLQQLISQN